VLGGCCSRRTHLGRDRGDQADRPLPPAHQLVHEGDPGPVTAGASPRRHHGRQRAHPARRDRPRGRRRLPAHPDRLGADCGERRLLRRIVRERAILRRLVRRHPDRPVRLRGRRRRRRPRGPAQAEVFAVTDRRTSEDTTRCPRSCRAPWTDRGHRQPRRCPHRRPTASPTWTTLTNGLHPARW